MRRIVVTEFGGPLELVDCPDLAAAAGEVVVDVEVAGVSFVDGLIARGGYQVKPPLPFTPGSTAAGRVSAVGDGVDPSWVGRRVALLLLLMGGYASQLIAPVEDLLPLPDGVSAGIAATSIESYGTMLFALRHRVSVTPGEWVVVLGAGGGIGLAAVDTAAALGARVVGVASSESKRAAAAAAGASVTLGYDGLKDAIRTTTGGGADVVVDPVGGPAAEAALRALRAGGRFCVLGFASGEIPRLPANLLLLNNRSAIGVDWGGWARGRAAESLPLLEELFDRIAAGTLHPAEPELVPLGEAPAVLDRFAARAVTGKIGLVTSAPTGTGQPCGATARRG